MLFGRDPETGELFKQSDTATGGWGFGRWLGTEQRPYGTDANFAQECFGCHAGAKDSDWVFTTPVHLP
mgnify:CR=1 FL=1